MFILQSNKRANQRSMTPLINLHWATVLSLYTYVISWSTFESNSNLLKILFFLNKANIDISTFFNAYTLLVSLSLLYVVKLMTITFFKLRLVIINANSVITQVWSMWEPHWSRKLLIYHVSIYYLLKNHSLMTIKTIYNTLLKTTLCQFSIITCCGSVYLYKFFCISSL